jgi:phosphatidylglycerophosphatase A
LLYGTAGGAGFAPVAPGTAGALVGVILLLIFSPRPWILLSVTTLVFLVGVPVASRCEEIFGQPDASEIVIDEVVGVWVSLLFLPLTWPTIAAGFVLFRVFDIWKPWPVRQVEHLLPSGLGVMVDDVLAGIYANLGVRLLLATNVLEGTLP